jgi:hypothetical protein
MGFIDVAPNCSAVALEGFLLSVTSIILVGQDVAVAAEHAHIALQARSRGGPRPMPASGRRMHDCRLARGTSGQCWNSPAILPLRSLIRPKLAPASADQPVLANSKPDPGRFGVGLMA